MAKITHYDVGDLWIPQATFTINGTPTDPTNLTVRQQDASGTETVLLNNAAVSGLTGSSTPVAKTGTGIFKLNPGITLNASGYWYVKFEGTGAAQATEQQEAIVDPDEFTSDAGVASYALVGLSETKDWLQQQNVDTSSDLELVRCINDISMRFQVEAEREFKPLSGTNPQVRTFDVDELGYFNRVIRVGDLSTFTQVRVLNDLGNQVQVVNSSDIITLPRVKPTWAPVIALRFSRNVFRPWYGDFPYQVEVTGNFGFPSVPGDVRQAVLDAVADVMDRDVESYRQDLGPATTGGEQNVIVMSTQVQLLDLPPSALAVARRYRNPFF